MVSEYHRSTGDWLVLMIAGTVCFSVIAGGAIVAALALFRPEVDTTKAINSIRDVIGTLLGLVSGFLAGRQHAAGETRRITPAPPPELDDAG